MFNKKFLKIEQKSNNSASQRKFKESWRKSKKQKIKKIKSIRKNLYSINTANHEFEEVEDRKKNFIVNKENQK